MSFVTQKYIKIPWAGGINDSVDPGMLPDTDLVAADNLIFKQSGSRLKREALNFFDTDLPTVISRSSSGTTRTLVFSSSVLTGSDERLVLNENITVSGSPAAYNVTAAPILTITTTTLANDTITYTATGSLSESITGASLTVLRSSPYLATKDYWRTDASYDKQQLLIVATSQGKIFRYNSSGQRIEITPAPETWTIQCLAASTLTTGHYFTFYSALDAVAYYGWYNVDAGGGDPAIGGKTGVPIAVLSTATAAEVATATQAAIDALAGHVATIDTFDNTLVIVTNAAVGVTTHAADVNTGFTGTIVNRGRAASAPFPTAITQVSMEVMNEKIIIAFDGINNKPIKYNPNVSAFYLDLPGNPPDASVVRMHQSRLWMNDKQNKDRAHYSPPGDPEMWQGVGDSGAVDVYPGDGDATGIVSIHPTFKGEIVIGKSDKVYRIIGDSPDNYQPLLITDGLGVVSHSAVSLIDLDDEFFVSGRGIHSIATTANFGDFTGEYLSKKIQKTFKTFNSGRLRYTQSVYIAELNSVFYSIAEDGSNVQNALWIFNVELKEWYRWPDISCQSLTRRKVGAANELVIGTANSRILKIDAGVYTDYGSIPYTYRVKTGTLYPSGNPTTWIGFKKLGFLFKPLGNFTFTAIVTIDNQAPQSFSFSQASGGDVLGTTFRLGTSRLGSSNVLAPYMQDLDGFGRGCTIEILSSGSSEQVEIYGFIIEYESAETAQEVIESN